MNYRLLNILLYYLLLLFVNVLYAHASVCVCMYIETYAINMYILM